MSTRYDRELIARMLEDYDLSDRHYWTSYSIGEQIRLLREADEAEAAGVGTVRVASDN